MSILRTAPADDRQVVGIDPERWPYVAEVPDNQARALAARAVVAGAVRRLPMRLRRPDGTVRGGGGAGDPELRLVRPADFHQRLGSRGLIGFGESYMAGDWDAEDLAGVLTVLAENASTLVPAPLQRLRRVAVPRRPDVDVNTREGSRANIAHHYDLSNELFRTFLDPTLSYSAALFPTDPTVPLAGEPVDLGDGTLADAQRHKVARMLDVAGVGPGRRLLEIGTGWGELALEAADRGADVTTITLSQEQASLARSRLLRAGLGDRATVILQDYRDTEGTYDAIVSVEMIEAVGAEHWDEYFSTLARLLAPGGRAGLQAITMPHDRMLASRDTGTWVLAYIFPGGAIPSKEVVAERSDAAGLRVDSALSMGMHYAETLRRWRARFEARAEDVAALGFDEVFRRMWSFYLAYSEAGFRSGYLDVVQYGLSKPDADHQEGATS
ncbi:SAM-dependent methyltransferase [Mumia zhuanghuii]|uniref:Class I SAM-dependent methyltransferase n=1 Tax=Mumia zhuanghuii TaxID=2585211 RepID=A0A5C4MP36_9ACTN|nr:cyclopropane-fatty-acyl-phospholipid synthase family protein [Mumia zhuanghuii]TNC47071.1 class I SAM-dependent methyltransferase [Mumia zhuanghuii]TNC50373.1 class I SAM-dependent methyltransferase [Mumia zhuanghuii]